jgi:hypothetical protein
MASYPARLLGRALASGTAAALATAAVASWLGRRHAGSSAAPLNATSHVAWGERAARRDGASLKYTGAGFLINYGACIFWALFYEGLGRPGRPRARALRDGALVSAAAYVTDYHLVPRRLTPGFELRLPDRALALIYAALGLGLCARDLVARRRASVQPAAVGAAPRTEKTLYGFAAGEADVMELAADDLARTSPKSAVPLKGNRPPPDTP